MDSAEIFTLLSEVFSCDQSSFDMESSIHNHNDWTSLTHVGLVISLGEKYGVEFTPENLEKCISVKGILETLETEAHT